MSYVASIECHAPPAGAKDHAMEAAAGGLSWRSARKSCPGASGENRHMSTRLCRKDWSGERGFVKHTDRESRERERERQADVKWPDLTSLEKQACDGTACDGKVLP